MTTTRPFPMLAAPLPDTLQITPGQYVAEEKFDGHRIMFRVVNCSVTDAWSRTGKECMDKLNTSLEEELGRLPDGVYDAELILRGGHSYDVARLENHQKLEVVVFDLIEVGASAGAALYVRRAMLEGIFQALGTMKGVHLATQWKLNSNADLARLTEEVWARSGEGLIVKSIKAPYSPGKRPRGVFMKVKQCGTEVMTVVGFQPWQGEVVDRGPCACVLVRDAHGVELPVKTLNDTELMKLNTDHIAYGPTAHPALGRKLRIEYHEKTPDGSYRHPRWDRWEDE